MRICLRTSPYLYTTAIPPRITVYERPGQVFTGHVIRHPNVSTPAARTMLVEVDPPNTDFALLSRNVCSVQNHRDGAARERDGGMVRDDALVFRDGKVFVPVVRSDRLRLIPVVLGYDNGLMVQVEWRSALVTIWLH